MTPVLHETFWDLCSKKKDTKNAQTTTTLQQESTFLHILNCITDLITLRNLVDIFIADLCKTGGVSESQVKAKKLLIVEFYKRIALHWLYKNQDPQSMN